MAEVDVFVCYSREDTEWKDHVVSFLEVMRRAGEFAYGAWHDRDIAPGSDWEQEIAAAMNEAKVALLLISADFLQSDYILGTEVPRLRERRDAGELVIVRSWSDRAPTTSSSGSSRSSSGIGPSRSCRVARTTNGRWS